MKKLSEMSVGELKVAGFDLNDGMNNLEAKKKELANQYNAIVMELQKRMSNEKAEPDEEAKDAE